MKRGNPFHPILHPIPALGENVCHLNNTSPIWFVRIKHRIRYKRKYQPLTHMIPFGPYLCVGFLIVFFFGMDPLFKAMEIYQSWIERMLHGG